MEFHLDLNYNHKSVTAMTKAIRLTMHEKQDKETKTVGWILVAVCSAVLLFSGRFGWAQILGVVLIIAFSCYLIWGDHVDAYFALDKLPKEMRTGHWRFQEENYFNQTVAGESMHSYQDIFTIMETDGYIFLMLHNGAMQILELGTIKGGTPEEFRKLLRKKTSLTIQVVD